MSSKRKSGPEKPNKGKGKNRPGHNAFGHIELNPKVMLGKPVIRGTRIPVELILRKLGEGATETDLISAYPRLTHEDILAAFSFGAASLAHDEPVLP